MMLAKTLPQNGTRLQLGHGLRVCCWTRSLCPQVPGHPSPGTPRAHVLCKSEPFRGNQGHDSPWILMVLLVTGRDCPVTLSSKVGTGLMVLDGDNVAQWS